MAAFAKRLLALLCITASAAPAGGHDCEAACSKVVVRQRLQIARLRAEVRALRRGRVAAFRRASSTVLDSTGVAPCDSAFDLDSNEAVQRLASHGCSHVVEIRIHSLVSSLAGLESLTSVSKLNISNSHLSTLRGLDNLTNVSGELRIAGNVELTSLSGLQGLQSAGAVIVDDNKLDSLAGLEGLVSVENISVTASAWITSLSGLEYVVTLHQLIIADTGVSSLTGLESLTSVARRLYIGENEQLTSLSGLENLRTAGELHIRFNQNLASLAGLELLSSTPKSVNEIVVLGNPNLRSISALRGLTTIATLMVRDNALRSLSGLQNLVSVRDVLYITGNSRLSTLNGIRRLESAGEFIIEANFNLTSLKGLERLVSVPTMLSISNCRSLTSLEGLENLASVGSLRLTDNRHLNSLVGLGNLVHAWGGITIHGCPSLHSLQGLDSLNYMAQLNVRDSGPLRELGGPFAPGMQVGKVEFDELSWPRCITPHEREAVVSAVGFMEFSAVPNSTWQRWRENSCGWERFVCTKGHACHFVLDASTGPGGGYIPLLRVFISERNGACGTCLAHRPQSRLGEGGEVVFGYDLTSEEAGSYSICRCGSLVGPVGELVLRGPREISEPTVCPRGAKCSIKIDGEELQPTDEVLLASSCQGHTSSHPLAGIKPIVAAGNVYHLHDVEDWHAASPNRYEVCWRAPCAVDEDGSRLCPVPHQYFKAGDVELQGIHPQESDLRMTLGDQLIVPNTGFGVLDSDDRLRILPACGELDENKLDDLVSSSVGMQFDFKKVTDQRARPGYYRLCWCRAREGVLCNASWQFAADSGGISILCPAGQEPGNDGSCRLCVPGTRNPSPGLIQCSECPIGHFSSAGATVCEACPTDHFAPHAGSSSCDECAVWQLSLANGAACSSDPANVVLAVAFLASVGAACALLTQVVKMRRLVVDVSVEDGRTIVTVFKSHGLSNKCGRSFPVTFCETGQSSLDSPEEPFRARVKDAARLELRTSKGGPIENRLDTSVGVLTVPFPYDAYHTGRPVNAAFCFLLLCFLALILGVAIYMTEMGPVAFLGAPIITLLCMAASLAVRRRYWKAETPLAKRLAEFKLQIRPRSDQPVETRDKGPDRAISVGKLHELHNFFRDFIRDRPAYYLTSNILKPLTKAEDVSYAELVGAGEVEWFVSHFWGTSFEHFCKALQKHAETFRGERHWTTLRYWVCFCSNNQHQIAEEIGASWKESSFYLTLQSGLCRGTCMVLDDQALPLTRIWCIFELLQTVMLERTDEQFQGLLLCTSSGVLNSGSGSVDVAMALAKKVAEMDLGTARATIPRDEEMIRAHVMQELGSFTTLNQFLRDAVRDMLVSARTNSNQQFDAVFELLDEGFDNSYSV